MVEPTIRSMVADIQREVLETADLPPTRAAELQNALSSLLGNCNKEVTAADLDYKLVLLGAMRSEEKANRARIAAETTPQYRRYREAKDARDTCLELLRSLRAYLRNAAEEMRMEK
jgi:uncharacterized protein YjaG (DUF416 family)